MKTLFKIWLIATILSMTVYTPFYLFSNNAIDAIEELTPIELIPLISTRGQDPEHKASLLKNLGINTSMELKKALKKNDLLSKIKIEYVNSKSAMQIEAATGLKTVQATAELENGNKISIVFNVVPKAFLKSNAVVVGIQGMFISDDESSLNVLNEIADQTYVWALFSSESKNRTAIIDLLSRKFDAKLTAQKETQSPKEEKRTSNRAGSLQNNMTVAGNPSPDQIIIFQWDGQPAYCADEGIDGPICRGDGSVFIGQGTHQDYMDQGSEVCIAGQSGCTLPKYFDHNVRG